MRRLSASSSLVGDRGRMGERCPGGDLLRWRAGDRFRSIEVRWGDLLCRWLRRGEGDLRGLCCRRLSKVITSLIWVKVKRFK